MGIRGVFMPGSRGWGWSFRTPANMGVNEASGLVEHLERVGAVKVNLTLTVFVQDGDDFGNYSKACGGSQAVTGFFGHEPLEKRFHAFTAVTPPRLGWILVMSIAGFSLSDPSISTRPTVRPLVSMGMK